MNIACRKITDRSRELGFWGTFVVHRDERLLWDLLPDVAKLEDAELCYDAASAGWQVTRVFAMPHDLPRSFLEDVRDLTGAPALAAAVLDSDAAVVRAVGPRTPGWQTWLNPEMAVDHLVNSSPTTGDYEQKVAAVRQHILEETAPDARATSAVAWAAEAGLKPCSREEVREALIREEVPVEDVLFALLDRLGLAADEVETPVRPSFVEVLRAMLGHRLDAVEVAAHQPVRGERLSFPGMRDLRFHFDGCPTLTACGCGRQFALFPNALWSEPTQTPVQGERSISEAVSDVLGRELTDAATVGYRFFPDVKGIVLRFGGADLFLAAVDGHWAVDRGPSAPPHSANYGSRGPDDLYANPWIAR